MSSVRRWLSWLMIPAILPALSGCGENLLVLRPEGPVAKQELDLIVLSTVLLMIVFVPVMVMFFRILQRYRDRPDNTAPYEPEWSESGWLEVVWWGVPITIVAIMSVATIRTTYALTRPPQRVVGPPVVIQVTSLDWKWLFQYPGQKVATVNYCVIPTNQPVQFELTAKSPMNGFWVPQLGGQEYAMPGMAMRLWLQADKPGTYFGTAANFTGRAFAHMTFHVNAMRPTDFQQWAATVRRTQPALTLAGYRQLTNKEDVVGQMTFSSYPPGVFYEMVQEEGGMYSRHDMSMLEEQHHD